MAFNPDLVGTQARRKRCSEWLARWDYMSVEDFQAGVEDLPQLDALTIDRIRGIMQYIFWGILYSTGLSVFYTRYYKLIVVDMAFDANPEMLMRTPRLPAYRDPVHPCEYFALFWMLEDQLFTEDRDIKLRGGSFSGSFADMMAANPTTYVPTIPEFGRCPTPARGGGEKGGQGVQRGGGRDTGHGGRDGGRQGRGTIMPRLGPPMVASVEGSAPKPRDYDCEFCHNRHATNSCWYVEFHWEAIACVTDDTYWDREIAPNLWERGKKSLSAFHTSDGSLLEVTEEQDACRTERGFQMKKARKRKAGGGGGGSYDGDEGDNGPPPDGGVDDEGDNAPPP